MKWFKTLREANIARDRFFDPDKKLDLMFRSTELAGEVGEACNVLKKLERERRGVPGSRDTLEHAAEELADIVICADLCAMELGIDLAKAIPKKFNMTSDNVGFPVYLETPGEDN